MLRIIIKFGLYSVGAVLIFVVWTTAKQIMWHSAFDLLPRLVYATVAFVGVDFVDTIIS